MSGWDVRDAGDSALLLQFEPVIDAAVNGRAVATADAFRRLTLAGVRDVLPTYRSVAVHVDPREADTVRIRAALDQLAGTPSLESPGRLVEIPVSYGGEEGPDLQSVAAWAGIDVAEVARRHAAVVYRVFMIGFLPGFPYLGPVDSVIAAPRHPAPRVRVPAGAVGIAGRQTGIYPFETPGGWQIIGRTPIQLFDASRVNPALLASGDSVRFVPLAAGAASDARAQGHRTGHAHAALRGLSAPVRTCTVLRPGLLSTIQDRGRWGFQALGVPVSGAIDARAHDRANAAIGNAVDAATLEVTVQGPELRFDTPTDIAIAGADLDATLDGRRCPDGKPIACRAGTVLRFGARRRGARAYVAFSGGIVTRPVLGSRSTHVRTSMGGLEGRALRAGDRLPLAASAPGSGSVGVETWSPLRTEQVHSGPVGARLRILPGPQEDFFDSRAFELLETNRFVITPASDRMGYRLHAPRPIPTAADREMISDATVAGGIQVPPSGHPILLLADRQTTGGYPQIAVVIAADLPLAGQLVPGDWVELRLCSHREAIRALHDASPQGHAGA